VICGWWEECPAANVGIATGGGLVVLDEDGTDGAASLEGKHLPPTPCASTGKGLHRYFASGNGQVRNAVRLLPGVDLRGEGGYVVAPPSIHPSGAAYAWCDGLAPDEVALAPMPDWLANLLGQGRPPQGPAPQVPERIAEGQRNAALTSLAGTMRRHGMGVDAIEAALLADNAARCDPPLAETEVRQIAQSVARYPAPDNADAVAEGLAEPTDAGNAVLIAALYGDRLRFDHPRQRWLLWRGHWWSEDVDGAVQRLALDAAHYRYTKAWDLPEEAQKDAIRWAVNSRQNHRLSAALSVAKVLPPLADAGEWDTEPHLLGVVNGVVDLRTGALLEGDPGQRITRHVPLVYDANAACPRWQRFVLEVCDGREDLAEYMRLAAGYSITAETSEQCLFVCHGRGSTGKSTLLGRIAEISGPYGRTASFEAFADPPGHLESLAVLAGARFVTSSETREHVRLNEQRLKVLSHGNDRMAAAVKYGHEFEFTPCCKLWLGLNHRPRVQDDSTGFWRSVRLVPFEREFSPLTDPSLKATLQAELPGILAWAVRGARDWYRHGLPQVAEVQTATEVWRAESDPLAEWLETACVERAEARTPFADLWESYLDWTERQRLPVKERLSRLSVGKRLTDRFGKSHLVKMEGKPVRFYTGLGLQL
jgi:putative DNA primase/helicase